MNNADTPAMPLALDIRVDESGNQFCNDAYEGLTKREHFAGLAMQGILANSTTTSWTEEQWFNVISKQALNHADALLKQLGEQNEQD